MYHQSSDPSPSKHALGFLRLWSVGVLPIVVDSLHLASELLVELLLPALSLEQQFELSTPL